MLSPSFEPADVVVLDTNAVLDWQVFRDPAGQSLWQALESGSAHWMASPAMLDELSSVLARPLAPRWEAPRQRMLAGGGQAPTMVEAAERHDHGLLCADPDDQKFLDFALGLQARWLITRDRALLALSRRAADTGLNIVVPGRWPETN